MKKAIVHNNPNLRPTSVRLLVALAAIFRFKLLTTDATEAYLQSARGLMRNIYIESTTEFELGKDQVLNLLNPIYDLSDSGDYWGKNLSFRFLKEREMTQVTSDSEILFYYLSNELHGLCATYFEDLFHTGNEVYDRVPMQTEAKFKFEGREYDNDMLLLCK